VNFHPNSDSKKHENSGKKGEMVPVYVKGGAWTNIEGKFHDISLF
jgi:hypothetical protein